MFHSSYFMKKLRILLTCDDYLPHVGGAEVCTANLRKQLMRLGHTVTLYTNTTARMRGDAEAGVIRVPWRFRPGALLKNYRTLTRLIKQCDVVHSQYSFRLACL